MPPFICSFIPSWAPSGPWNLSALQPLAAWRGGGPKDQGEPVAWLTAGEAVKVRPLVRGGGEGAALPKGHLGPCEPKGHLGPCEPKGHLGRCDDWDSAAMPPSAASAESSPSLTAQLAPRKAAPGQGSD